MTNNSLEDIVKCKVEIASPTSEEETFDKILIVVPKPTNTGKLSTAKAFEISSAAELIDYGFDIESVAYKAAAIAFGQNPAPSSLVVYVRKTVESKNETITEALNNAYAELRFYAFHLTSYNDASSVSEASAWAAANEKLYFVEYTDIDEPPVIAEASKYRTVVVFSGKADAEELPDENKYLALAWAAKCVNYQPGSETWALKEINLCTPSLLTNAEKNDLNEKNINSFRRYAGTNVTIGGTVYAGEWIDVIRFRDWLKAEVQKNVFNVLRTNRKIPFTDAGIGLIEGAIEKALRDGQNIGGIAPASYDADGNETPGYIVSLPKASELTEAERATRKLKNCRYSARLAGAIHVVEIEGYLTF